MAGVEESVAGFYFYLSKDRKLRHKGVTKGGVDKSETRHVFYEQPQIIRGFELGRQRS